MMYGFAMAKPPRPTVKIGLTMTSPYAIPIFCDENRQNKPRSRGFRRSDGWFTARRQVTYTLFLSYFAFLTTDKPYMSSLQTPPHTQKISPATRDLARAKAEQNQEI